MYTNVTSFIRKLKLFLQHLADKAVSELSGRAEPRNTKGSRGFKMGVNVEDGQTRMQQKRKMFFEEVGHEFTIKDDLIDNSFYVFVITPSQKLS